MSLLVYLSDVAPYARAGGNVPAGVHRSLGTAGRALEEVAGLHGLGFYHARRAQDLDKEVLAEARALALFTIGETAWSAGQRQLIEARATQGELGLLGLHSATDSAYEWPAFAALLGGRFAGHPVTAELPVSVVDKAHPATAHLPSPWLFEEELYLFRDIAPDARALLGVRPADLSEQVRQVVADHLAASGLPEVPELLPLAWCLKRQGLRSFYTALGHFLSAYEDTRYMLHLAGALEWLLGADDAYLA